VIVSATLEIPAPQKDLLAASPSTEPIVHTGSAADHQIRTSLELIGELYNYNHWIFNKVRPFIKGRVCEVGCGTGTITQYLLNYDEVVGIEPLTQSFREARTRFRQHLNTRFVNCFLANCPNDAVSAAAFDTVVCLNVLEHIEDDVDGLSRMSRLCQPGGRVVVLVPAHMSLYGGLDESFGHHRRYNRRTLRCAFVAAGLQPTYSFYMNVLGYFGWWWQSRCLRREQISVHASRLFNRLVPFLDAAERLLPPPFGQSLVMIGTPIEGK